MAGWDTDHPNRQNVAVSNTPNIAEMNFSTKILVIKGEIYSGTKV